MEIFYSGCTCTVIFIKDLQLHILVCGIMPRCGKITCPQNQVLAQKCVPFSDPRFNTTLVSGGFLQNWAQADSVVFVHHDSAVLIASLRDCGILPVRCTACFISCYILYVLMLCLVLFYSMFACLLLCESCVFKVCVRFFSLLLCTCNNVCAC